MALEATLVYELEPAVPFLCAAAIEKGALLVLTDPRTVATTTGDTDAIIGIAAEEKTAAEITAGNTSIAVYLRGVFKGFAGVAGVTVGQGIITDTATGAANELVNADINSEHIVGRALETAADTESFLFLLAPFSANLA